MPLPNHLYLAFMGMSATLATVQAAETAPVGHHGAANQHMQSMDFDTLVRRFETGEHGDRDTWQKPDAVIAALGDIQGKTVMDLGAGTGYFSLRLAAAGANVIAADVDPRFQKYIQERLTREKPAAPGTVVTRHLGYDSPGLAQGEADRVLMVDVYHHIEQREDYLPLLRGGLKPSGELIIVDFKKEPTPDGPPPAMRLSPEEIRRELVAAGFRDIAIDTALLPYQYVIKAHP